MKKLSILVFAIVGFSTPCFGFENEPIDNTLQKADELGKGKEQPVLLKEQGKTSQPYLIEAGPSIIPFRLDLAPSVKGLMPATPSQQETFKPSETISEDLSVSFPIDI